MVDNHAPTDSASSTANGAASERAAQIYFGNHRKIEPTKGWEVQVGIESKKIRKFDLGCADLPTLVDHLSTVRLYHEP